MHPPRRGRRRRPCRTNARHAQTRLPIHRELDAYRYTDPEGTPFGGPEAPDPQAVTDGTTVVVEHPEGRITLERPDGIVFLANSGLARGDFDGDGRIDLLVFAYRGSEPDGLYAISGDVDPGRYDPGSVGVHLPDGEQWFYAVGDQDGDGGEDLALGDQLYSGRAFLADGPGAVIDVPKPFRTVESLVGVLEVDGDGRPALVRMDSWAGDPPVFELRVEGDDVVCLRSEDVTAEGPPITGGPPPHLEGWLVDGHRVIQATFSSRSGTTVYRWDLDAPS